MPGGCMNHHHWDRNITDDYDHHDLIEMLVRKDKDDENNRLCRDGKGSNHDRDHENNSDSDNYDENTNDITEFDSINNINNNYQRTNTG